MKILNDVIYQKYHSCHTLACLSLLTFIEPCSTPSCAFRINLKPTGSSGGSGERVRDLDQGLCRIQSGATLVHFSLSPVEAAGVPSGLRQHSRKHKDAAVGPCVFVGFRVILDYCAPFWHVCSSVLAAVGLLPWYSIRVRPQTQAQQTHWGAAFGAYPGAHRGLLGVLEGAPIQWTLCTILAFMRSTSAHCGYG